MRKTLLTLVVLLAIGFTASAQLDFGIKLGTTMSDMKMDFKEDVSNAKNSLRTSYQFGAFAAIGKKLYVQPEILIIGKGGTTDVDIPAPQGVANTFNDVKYNTKLTTIDIPVMLGYKFIDMEVFNLRAMAGPVASFTLKQDENLTVDGVEQSVAQVFGENGKDFDMKKAIWGIQAGVGVDVMMFRLDVKYEWGLNNLSNVSAIDIKSHSWLISLGWKIF